MSHGRQVVLALIGLVGAGAIVAGTVGAASANRADLAMPYVVSGGLAGTALVAVAAALLATYSKRRDDEQEQVAIAQLIDDVARRLEQRAPR